MEAETLGKIAAYAVVPFLFAGFMWIFRKIMNGIFSWIEGMQSRAAQRAQRRESLTARAFAAGRYSSDIAASDLTGTDSPAKR